MLTKLLIYRQDQLLYSFAYAADKLIFCLQNEGTVASEAIFTARISRLNSASHSAFIEYLPAKSGFVNLPPSLKLQEGSQLSVQLTWVGNQDKQAKFRCGWQLVGKYLVYLGPTNPGIKSKGLDPAKCLQLEEAVRAYPGQWIARTSVSQLDNWSCLVSEMQRLHQQAAAIFQAKGMLGEHYPGTPGYLKILRSLTLAADCEVVSNDFAVYQQLLEFQELWQVDQLTFDPALAGAVLVERYQQELATSQVRLANGAGLEIHSLAGLNIIDVNSDKLQVAHASLNFVVVDAIYQQICRRNLVGIILIDFVKNMSQAEQSKVINYLHKLFSVDITNTKVLGFTNAGLCEIIRSKF